MKLSIITGALLCALFLCALVAGSSIDYELKEPWTQDRNTIAATVSGSNNYCPPQDGLTKLSQVPERCKHGEYINK